MPLEKCEEIIVEGRSRHFDPDVVDAFLAERDAFVAIAERYADTEESIQEKAASLGVVTP
jgi:putative two-component system response regulator